MRSPLPARRQASPSPSAPIRVLAVDDHELFREGISALVGSQPDMTLVGEASNGREGIEQFRIHRPDVTLMDLQMPEMEGIEALTLLRARYPDARIVVLTTYKGDAQATRALKLGARAYLLKGLLRKELLDTIRAVHRGERRIGPEMAAELAYHIAEDALSDREIDVLRLIAEGNSNREIAYALVISEDTAKSHVKSIMLKLGANDRTHAVMIGLRRGFIVL
ncbi:MAG: response regulator transcription factor [Steroidobacteraceae bacterium]